MKVVVLGCKGQLGSDCVTVLREHYEVVGVDIENLDITDLVECEAWLDWTDPDVVVNAAAMTNVDACETEREAAFAVNAEAPGVIARWVEKNSSFLVHISTDYVFDGTKLLRESYIETDLPNPLSVYGASKLAGERAVMDATGRYAIVRTAWMYGLKGRNFPKTMLKLAMASPFNDIRVVNDQFGTPTWSYRLARQIRRLIEEDARGLFHATGAGWSCSWYDVARRFLERMEMENVIVPVSSAEFPRPAKRPVNSRLLNKGLMDRGWNIMGDWQQDLDEFVLNHKYTLRAEAATLGQKEVRSPDVSPTNSGSKCEPGTNTEAIIDQSGKTGHP